MEYTVREKGDKKMILQNNQIFILQTVHTTYAFHVLPSGHLEHLYYGRKIRVKEPLEIDSIVALVEKHAFTPGSSNSYSKEHMNFSLEDMRLEISGYGKGDIREPFIEVIHADGSYTCDFVYDSFSIEVGKDAYETLPGSYDEKNEVEHLCITMKDRNAKLALELHYYVYEDCDVITRSARFLNDSEDRVKLTRLMSTQLDFETADYVISTFNGAWAREMRRVDTPVYIGKHVNSSYAGISSNRANPFVMLSHEHTTEDTGDCYGCNLIYSGNHYEAVEVNCHNKTRFVAGINPQSFCFEIAPGTYFEAPEAVMTYSHEGYNGMSQHMHQFVNEHIVRGYWKKKERPLLLNSWEAAYFDINERKLLNLAKAGKEAGIELFVMDDGWFGNRNNDTCSLGDWYVNTKKLPGGVKRLCEKVNALGLDFGIWVEPEMVNVDSDLYRAHPDWAMDIPGKGHSEGRNQRILDFGREDVQNYMIDVMSELFGSCNIAYVKWDMNRIVSDYYSKELSPERQGEVAHRYVLGLYRVMRILTERFPKILFEGCSSGGNRFDLGILCYFPQIWASDDTDAMCRAEIQTGYSYGYPMSTVTAHVSACPNHQTLRNTPIETRFNVAAFGVLGYECNFGEMSKEDMEAIKAQIVLYKKWRGVLQYGNFYRGRTMCDALKVSGSRGSASVLTSGAGNLTEWTCVSEDRKQAVGLLMQKLVAPNTQFDYYKAKGLDEEVEYRFTNRSLKYNIKEFGSLVNMVAPVHIKQDSVAHNLISKFVKLDGEKEDCTAYGDALMYGGVHLKQAFAGTGYNNEIRPFQDFASRIYFMEENVLGTNDTHKKSGV